MLVCSCLIINGRVKKQIISYGENTFNNNGKGSCHAEINAAKRLYYNPNLNKRVKNIDLIVIKFSKSGIFGNSKPCYHCLKSLNKIVKINGYKIKNLIYSIGPDSCIKSSLEELLNSKDQHITLFHRRKS